MGWLDDPNTVDILSGLIGGVGEGALAYRTPRRGRPILAPAGGLLLGGANILQNLGQRRQNVSAIRALGPLSGLSQEETETLAQSGATPQEIGPIMTERRAQQTQALKEREETGRGLAGRLSLDVAGDLKSGGITPEELASVKPELAESVARYKMKPEETPGMVEALGVAPYGKKTKGPAPFDVATRIELGKMNLDPYAVEDRINAGLPGGADVLAKAQQAAINTYQQKMGGAKTAQMAATESYNQNRAWTEVYKTVIPYQTVGIKDPATGKTRMEDVPVNTTWKVGKIQSLPNQFNVRAVDAQRYAVLEQIAPGGDDLVEKSREFFGATPGGPLAAAARARGWFWGKPSYTAMQTSLNNMTENVTNGFSKRVSAALLTRVQDALSPETGSVDAVQAAVNDIKARSLLAKQELQAQGNGAAYSETTGNAPPTMPMLPGAPDAGAADSGAEGGGEAGGEWEH